MTSADILSLHKKEIIINNENSPFNSKFDWNNVIDKSILKNELMFYSKDSTLQYLKKKIP